MFGLAYWPNYHYYRGQVMWDIETFVFPPILLTDPQAADSLLYYRNERLHAARRNAALNGYRGLQLPWASGPLHGEEMIRVSAPLITLEQHVGLSVAMAFAQYAHATGAAVVVGNTTCKSWRMNRASRSPYATTHPGRASGTRSSIACFHSSA